MPRVWSVKRENFDNLYQAAITLLRLSSQDSLRPIFHAVMDIPAVTLSPKLDTRLNP